MGSQTFKLAQYPRVIPWALRGLATLISGGGCEKPAPIVSCDTVVESLHQHGISAAGEEGEALDRAEALALCLALETDADCDSERTRWFGCLASVEAGDASPACPRELLSVVACRDGDTYEYHCNDAEDGDDDGDVDCALLTVTEVACGDGLDDDGDCLIDLDDPDCGL